MSHMEETQIAQSVFITYILALRLVNPALLQQLQLCDWPNSGYDHLSKVLLIEQTLPKQIQVVS